MCLLYVSYVWMWILTTLSTLMKFYHGGHFKLHTLLTPGTLTRHARHQYRVHIIV